MAASILKPYNVNTEQDREDFIVSYITYVNSVAKAVAKQFNCPELDELRSCGYQGLLEATNHFDPTKNVNFKYYAYIRIYGHMLDYMRKLYAGSNATVALKKKINRLLDAQQANGSNLDSESLAKELGMSLEEYQKAQDKINSTTFVLNFTDLSGAGGENTDFDISDTFLSSPSLPEDDVILVDQLWKIMANRFPKRDKEIMELIYLHEITYPEIALKFGITDRRVSQLHLKCLAKLNRLVKKGLHTKSPEHRKRKKFTVATIKEGEVNVTVL